MELEGAGIMDIVKLIAELRQERERLDAAIQSLERLVGPHRKVGRPPKWTVQQKSNEEQEETDMKTTPSSMRAAASSSDSSTSD